MIVRAISCELMFIGKNHMWCAVVNYLELVNTIE